MQDNEGQPALFYQIKNQYNPIVLIPNEFDLVDVSGNTSLMIWARYQSTYPPQQLMSQISLLNNKSQGVIESIIQNPNPKSQLILL